MLVDFHRKACFSWRWRPPLTTIDGRPAGRRRQPQTSRLLRGLLLALPVSAAVPAEAVAQSINAQAAVEASRSFDILDSAQLAAMLQNKEFFLVNVHIPYQGEIPDTDALIPFDKISDNLDKLPSDKAAEIVVYCQSGRMSEIAAGALSRLGYTRVSHLTGGMVAWGASGRKLSQRQVSSD